MKLGMAELLSKRHLQNFGAEAGPAHAQQERMFETATDGVSGDLGQALQVGGLIFSHMQPAQPLIFLVAGPERSIAFPQAVDLIVVLPVLQRGIYRLLDRSRKITILALNLGLGF